jgi:hypothetical protein
MSPTLVINPHDDEIFATYAEVLVEHGADSMDDLERRLRLIYPRATVHARELSAEPFAIWYVYRDGHWTPSRPPSRTGEGTSDARSGAGSPSNRGVHSQGRR